MSILPMFGPHPQDSERDLAFKISMVNAFGREGVGTAAERDAAISALRYAAMAVAAKTCRPGPPHQLEPARDYGEQ